MLVRVVAAGGGTPTTECKVDADCDAFADYDGETRFLDPSDLFCAKSIGCSECGDAISCPSRYDCVGGACMQLPAYDAGHADSGSSDD